jgi:hypothetical protein
MNICTDSVMDGFGGISNVTSNLRLFNGVSSEGKGNRTLVSVLWLEGVPINRAPI